MPWEGHYGIAIRWQQKAIENPSFFLPSSGIHHFPAHPLFLSNPIISPNFLPHPSHLISKPFLTLVFPLSFLWLPLNVQTCTLGNNNWPHRSSFLFYVAWSESQLFLCREFSSIVIFPAGNLLSWREILHTGFLWVGFGW